MRYGLNHIFLFQVAAASLLSPDSSSAGASAAAFSAGASAAASSDFAAFASQRSFAFVPNSAFFGLFLSVFGRTPAASSMRAILSVG